MELSKKKRNGKFKKILIFISLFIIACGGAYVGVVYFESETPELEIHGSLEFIGQNATFSISAGDRKSGLRSVKLSIHQGGREHIIIDETFSRRGYSGRQMGQLSFNREVTLSLKDTKLKDGAANLVLVAQDYSLRGGFSGNRNETRHEVIIDTMPPKIRLLHAERYISPGGSGIVIYQLIGEASTHGADFSGHFHQGYPIGDGRDDVYISYIGLPYDTKSLMPSRLIAADQAGNKNSISFSPVFKNTVQKKDKINISDGFLGEKIPEFEQYYPGLKGDNAEKYIFVNNHVRTQNNKQISELCSNPVPERLWKGRFIRMSGASKAGYADHRSYYYKGKVIDHQVHLGMDIASTKRAEVKAANRGKVIFADYLGIYGNMVILDHGQGVFSLYSHLSQIQVSDGDLIDLGVVLGLSGKSGMAGGDHLHFSMLINGIFVTPKEWWDQQWIDVTIEDPIFESKF